MEMPAIKRNMLMQRIAFWSQVADALRTEWGDVAVHWRVVELRWRTMYHAMKEFSGMIESHEGVDKMPRARVVISVMAHFRSPVGHRFEFFECWRIADEYLTARQEQWADNEDDRDGDDGSDTTQVGGELGKVSVRDEAKEQEVDKEAEEARIDKSVVVNNEPEDVQADDTDRGGSEEEGKCEHTEELIQIKKRAVEAAEEKNALLEIQIGMMFFAQPPPDDEEGKEYYSLTRTMLLERARK